MAFVGDYRRSHPNDTVVMQVNRVIDALSLVWNRTCWEYL
jgi:hypothetical protein